MSSCFWLHVLDGDLLFPREFSFILTVYLLLATLGDRILLATLGGRILLATLRGHLLLSTLSSLLLLY